MSNDDQSDSDTWNERCRNNTDRIWRRLNEEMKASTHSNCNACSLDSSIFSTHTSNDEQLSPSSIIRPIKLFIYSSILNTGADLQETAAERLNDFNNPKQHI
jgi:hypothetical protein